MTEILLHVATAESGSRRAQRWILERSGELVEAHGLVPVRIQLRPGSGDGTDGGPVEIDALAVPGRPLDSSVLWSIAAPMIAAGDDDGLADLARQVRATLDAAASRYGRILLSGDGITSLLTRAEPHFLAALESLADQHRVRLLHYCAPQDRELEDAWTTYGFRTGRRPSEWLAEAAPARNHLATLARLGIATPRVEIDSVGYRADLLHGGDLEPDLAWRLLGTPSDAVGGEHERDHLRGDLALPLAVTDALRHAPIAELFPPGRAGLVALEGVSERLASGAPIPPEPDRLVEGRRLLTEWCRHKFEGPNKMLITAFSWPTDHFILEPVAGDLDGGVDGAGDEPRPDLAAIDALWAAEEPRDVPTDLIAAWTADSGIEPLTPEIASAAELVDLGCGRGDTVADAPVRFGVSGIGIDQRPHRVREAQRNGRAVYQGDILSVDPADHPSAKYVVIDNVLEHLPTVDAVRAALRVACETASRMVFIRHPSFDETDHLAALGCKLYWTDWPDEHVMPLRLAELLDLVIAEGVHRFEVRPILRIRDSDDPTVIPLDAAPNQTRIERPTPGVYDPVLHGPKPSVTFDRPVWYAFDLFLVVGPGDPIIEYPGDPEVSAARPRIRWRDPGEPARHPTAGPPVAEATPAPAHRPAAAGRGLRKTRRPRTR